MDKRALIAVALSLIVLLGYQYFFASHVPPAKPGNERETAAPQEGKSSPEGKAAVKDLGREISPVPASGPEKKVSVETPLYAAEFSTRGAVLTKWVLKKYTDSQGFPINLLKGIPEIKPMATGGDTDFNLRSALFAFSGTDLNLSGGHPEGTLVFSYASDTIAVRRTLKFYADSYKVDVTDEIGKAASYWVTLGEDFGITSVGGAITHTGPVLLAGTDRNEFKIKKLKEPNILTPVDLKWIALEDNYFFSALVPFTAPAEVKVWELQGTSMIAMELKEGVNKYMLYAGPKDIDQLAALHLGLEHIVDFGFFSIIARPIFWLLKFFNSFIGNYGWSIIILTIVLRIPFIPLLNKGQKSMKKLQELQPKMAEIKEKYKKDPQRMQREMMELYKRYKVNPMGGCLPMLLQIPFFFALYKVLLVSIELRGAPFILWIHDLSVKDPYYVLPIVMGITMLAQQKMTPTSADPSQAKIMMFMPVIFTFMFLNFSSGLVLYWLVSNLLSIVQQFFVNMAVKKEKAAAT